MNTPERLPRILAIGPKQGETPTGVSIAFENLIGGLEKNDLDYSVVDLTQDSTTSHAGRFNISRAFFLVARVFQAWLRMFQCDRVYLIVATSKLGFVRDFLLIWFAWLLRKETIVHLHGGGMRSFYEESSPWMQKLIRSVYQRVDKIIVLGEALRNQFSFVSNLEKIIVVENGLPEEARPATQVPHQSAPGREPFRFLYLSNLMGSKGYFRLLKAGLELEKNHSRKFQIHF